MSVSLFGMRRSFLALALLLCACDGSINPATADTDESDAEEGGARDPAEDASPAQPTSDGGQQQPSGRDAATDAARQEMDARPPSSADAARADATAAPGSDAASPPREDAGQMGQPDAARDGGGTTQPMAGTVPVFVAVGYGTRRIVSCDFGLTWKNDVEDVASGGDDATLPRGLGAGEGKFVAAVGGGGAQKLLMTEDGVSWTPVLDRPGRNGYSDVAYGLGRFVAGGGHSSIISMDGRAWGNEGTMGEGGILRHLAFGDYMGGRFVAVGDQGRCMNSSDGITWGSQSGSGESLIGVDYGAGVFVAITAGAATRYSEDGGATWKSGSISGASGVRGILFDGQQFIVTTGSNTFTSRDGKSWTMNSASGGPAFFAVSDDRKHYAGANNNVLYHSTDGISYMAVKMGGQAFTRVKFQRVKPSSVCPL